MDGLGLAAVIVTGALGFVGIGTNIWSTRHASKVARRGRVDERRVDACVEILRLVEHRTLWCERRTRGAELAGEPYEDAPALPQQPDEGEQAVISTLLVAYASPTLRDACSGWRLAAEAWDVCWDVAAWNYRESYHGPDTPTPAADLAHLKQALEKLTTECRAVETAIAQEIQRTQGAP